MVMRWLEPVIEQRTNEIFDRLWKEDEDIGDLKQKLADIFKSTEDPATKALVLELENLYILRIRRRINTSYRTGLSDGISSCDR